MRSSDRYGIRLSRALDLWVKLARTFSTIHHGAEDHVRSYDLTLPQFGVVECLGHKGPLTFTELSRKQLVSGGNMTVVVDNLQRDGLVERSRCAEDRRQIFVQLTPKGKKLFERMFPQHAEVVAQFMSVLAPEEQERLSILLKKLGTGVAQLPLSEDVEGTPEKSERGKRPEAGTRKKERPGRGWHRGGASGQ